MEWTDFEVVANENNGLKEPVYMLDSGFPGSVWGGPSPYLQEE